MFKIFFWEDKSFSHNTYFLNFNLDTKKISEFENDFSEELNNMLSEIKEKSQLDEVKIFYDDSPESVCGLYYMVFILNNLNCQISTVKLMEGKLRWKDIEDENYDNVASFKKRLTAEEKCGICFYWAKLKKENTNLKIFLNGKLCSVEDDFYDNFILRNCPENLFIKIAHLIAETIVDCCGISSDWIYKRIKVLISLKKIEIQCNHEFQQLIRRHNNEI